MIKKLLAVVMSAAMVIGSAISVSAGDTAVVGGMSDPSIYVQYKKETGASTYTVRIVADVAYSAENEAYAEYQRLGFTCSKSGSGQGDNYLGTNIYKTITADGYETEASGYWVVMQITGVDPNTTLYAQPIYENSANEAVKFGSEVSFKLADIVGSGSGEESGNGTLSLLCKPYDGTKYCAVVSGSTATGNVTIPSTYEIDGETYTVAAIGESAFLDCDELTGITLPSTIQMIEYGAFQNCYSLENVNISEGQINDIAGRAFYCCTSLKTITIPATVQAIGDYAFDGCTSLESITLSSSTSIGSNAIPSGVSVQYH